MDIQAILSTIEQANIEIKLKNGQLYVKGTQNDIPAAILDLIRANKLALTQWLTSEESTRLIPQKVDSDIGSHPLSSAQQRIWFTHNLEGSSAQYNMVYAWTLNGGFEVARFNQAVQRVITDHGMLRTTFKEIDGQPRQIIGDNRLFQLDVVEAQGCSESDFQSLCYERLRKEGETSFNLSEDLMMRGTLLYRSQQVSVLILTIHHIAADGWSEGLIKNAISNYYNSPETMSVASDVRWQYVDYIHHQKQLSYTRELNYWQRQLSDLPSDLSLPTDKIRPAEQRFQGAIHRTTLDASVYESAKALFRTHGVTPYMGLYTFFSLLLQRVTQREDIVVGTPVAGREQIEFSDVVGFFVNTLVLRTSLVQEDTVASAFHKCKRTVLEAMSHQRLPFDALVEAIQPSRTLERHPLFQVMFAFQTNEHGHLLLEDIDLKELEEISPKVIFDLQLDLIEQGCGLALEWRYNTDLFETQSIEKMASAFESLIKCVGDNPELPLGKLLFETPICGWSARIQQSLESHDLVEQAMIHQEMINGESHIVACIVPKKAPVVTDSDQIMSEWSTLFDDVYQKGDGGEFDIIGWNSSYTGALIPHHEMSEWLDNTIERIMSLSPNRIFEIGSGTGLLMYRLLPQCEDYQGIDPSATIIARHQANFEAKNITKARVSQKSAHEIDADALAGVDTIIINSVLQYFPNIDYLDSVIHEAVNGLECGRVFIGDVCNYQLQDEFYLSVERYKNPEGFRNSEADKLKRILKNKRAVERELMVSPEYFVHLKQRYPQISGVEILPKQGDAKNEMTRFRYDVIVYVDGSQRVPDMPNVEWDLGWKLAEDQTDFVLKGYPNQRVLVETQVANALCNETFSAVTIAQAEHAEDSIKSLTQLQHMAAEHGYCLSVQLSVTPAQASTTYDLIFTQHPLPAGAYTQSLSPTLVLSEQATQPSSETVLLDIESDDIEQAMLIALPSELRPTHYLFVSEIPKQGLSAVLKSVPRDKQVGDVVSDNIHPEMTQIWREVLRLDQTIELDDNFFDLGGHSLLATRLASVTSKKFAVDLTVRDVFIAQTVRGLAALVKKKREASQSIEALVSSEEELAGGITL